MCDVGEHHLEWSSEVERKKDTIGSCILFFGLVGFSVVCINRIVLDAGLETRSVCSVLGMECISLGHPV